MKIITRRYCRIDPFPLNHLRSKALICNKKENEDWRPGGHLAAGEGEHEQKALPGRWWGRQKHRLGLGLQWKRNKDTYVGYS